MTGAIVFSSLLAVVLWIVLWVYIAREFQHIAALKGFDESKYFWWTFWLGLVGMLMVAALPNRGASAAPVFRDELPEL